MERYGLITSIVGRAEKENSPPENGLQQRGKSSSSPLHPLQKCSPTRPTTTDQLVSILEENGGRTDGPSSRKPICLESKPPRRRESNPIGNILQVHLQRGGEIAAKYGGVGSSAGKQKIPRPANAFMLFANEWRKKLAIQNPRESNKDISVRLGVLWKNMAKGIKEKYFALAREVDAEHKRKYPGEKLRA
ncbi:transcription factor SOX-3-like [Neodiprion lecontei]|uniref:Sex-determining region Y protein n=1 Tax=Neodiprion lecontei TaxID=441921 RepID=A0ABM3GQT6_NEOLC|nr:transcription factor SOX-3-like [Neodiprion fabricii]XP_046602640.1 transcription factor SOX-3-like [Neodiprion lecontei]